MGKAVNQTSDLLGASRLTRCSDGHNRTGTVVYIHPYGIFETLEFDGRGGKWREAFILKRTGKCATKLKASGQAYTPAEDAEILASKNIAETAQKLDRTACAVERRKAVLLSQFRSEHRRKYTPEEDAKILASANFAETARKLGRTECAIQAWKAILRAEKQHVPHRQYTSSEDAEVLKSGNLSATGRKLGRSEASLWMRRRTLRRRAKYAEQA